AACFSARAADGCSLLTNRHFETLFQVRRETFVGKTDFDVHAREVAEQVRANDRAVLEAGAPLQVEEQVRHGGEVHTYVSVKFPIADPQGAPLGVCGIATDITAWKQTQERLTRINACLAELTLRDPQALGFEPYVAGTLEAAARALGVERASYWRLTEARDAIVCLDRLDAGLGGHTGKGETLRLADFPSYFAALQSGLSIAADDAHADPRTAEFSEVYLRPNHIRSMLDALVRRRSEVLGVVC